jgi:hypothetical protein
MAFSSKRPRDSSTRKMTVVWVVKPQNLYLIYSPAVQSESTRATLLAEVSVEGRLIGNFRWSLSGKELISMTFSLASINASLSEEDYELTWQLRPEDVELRHNHSSGDWEDLEDLISRGKISVSKGGEDGSHSLLGKSYIRFQNYISHS